MICFVAYSLVVYYFQKLENKWTRRNNNLYISKDSYVAMKVSCSNTIKIVVFFGLLELPLLKYLCDYLCLKKIPEQKLQAFSVGSMGARNLSKKELEELRKKEEEEAAAHVSHCSQIGL